ncbi:hypothetical protein ABK040_016837 [Willaertia magna]
MEEKDLLLYINEHNIIENSKQFTDERGIDHQQFYGVLNSLALANILNYTKKESKQAVLTPEGEELLKNGQSPEIQLVSMILQGPQEGINKTEAQTKVADFMGAFKVCMKNGWIAQEKGSDFLKKGNKLTDELPKDIVLEQLKLVSSGKFVITELEKQKGKNLDDLKAVELTVLNIENDQDGIYQTKKNQLIQEGCSLSSVDFMNLKSRKLVDIPLIKYFTITKGTAFSVERKKQETDLTFDLISSGAWKDLTFKEYNFKAEGKRQTNGYLHTLLKVRTEFRKIFLEMGFEEMATNNFVENSFWNFDALFQPQQHPARDAHDTFFLEVPKECLELPEDGYLEKVKETHEREIEEAKKNLLRTHTTAVSSRYLRQLGKDLEAGKPFTPRKYFSIDRVFRNEVPDRTHLCEFHQCEVLSLKRIGITNLKFKPAYNPYTEPSMEIFGYHPLLEKWVEVGNSGMFRPEMLRPMGLPEDIVVLAWGLSLERPTMIKYGIDNIRDLVGHAVDLQSVRKNPICRIDKNKKY